MAFSIGQQDVWLLVWFLLRPCQNSKPIIWILTPKVLLPRCLFPASPFIWLLAKIIDCSWLFPNRRHQCCQGPMPLSFSSHQRANFISSPLPSPPEFST